MLGGDEGKGWDGMGRKGEGNGLLSLNLWEMA